MSRVGSGKGRARIDGRGAGALVAALLVSVAPLGHAKAQEAAPSSAAMAATPASTSVVINLIRLLVQEGVLTQDKANALIRQAQDEAVAAARAQGAASVALPVPVPASAGPAYAGAAYGTASTSVRVPYVPEIVKKQITEQVKQQVMQQAKAEGWAAPNEVPEWVKRFHVYGDMRLRYEWDLFDQRNSPFFPNFASLDAGSPFDLENAAGTPPPFLDTTADRERVRIRARLGLTAEIGDGFSAGMRLATGNTTNPVSTNQTLGTDLNKDNFLLDRAYLKYQPAPWLTFWAGRFTNPWLSTDLVWSKELNFDGAAIQLAPPLTKTITPFFTAGAFPIENTAFNFPDNSTAKQPSRDKWLYGGQLGADWQPNRHYDLKLGAAFYDFDNIEGETEGPCFAQSSADVCPDDNSRPGNLQQGNTLFAIRNSGIAAVGSQAAHLFEYYGLASPFRELNVTARFDFARFDPIHVILDGDFVTNLAFNSTAVAARKPVNNRGQSPDGTTVGPFAGGANGYQARITVGYPEIDERWDWDINAAYKYLESDAVVDAFTDSDFHLGGTNAKGYIVGGELGVAHNIYLSSRWLSASEISGPPYTVDVIQVDLNGRF